MGHCLMRNSLGSFVEAVIESYAVVLSHYRGAAVSDVRVAMIRA
jgi:hypothetical protein